MKKISYKGKNSDDLKAELAKLQGSLREATLVKMKTGKAEEYRTTRKNIARVMTEINNAGHFAENA